MIDFIIKVIRYILLPIILLLFWILGAVLFNSKISFSTLFFRYPDVSVQGIRQHGLFAGEKYMSEFTSHENYLGIITLQFEKFDKTDFRKEDILSFRIREKGRKTWYFESVYRSGLIHDSLHFPFGFPPISDSKNKIYEFELISQRGNSTHAIELDRQGTLLSSYHAIPRSEITSSKDRFLSFFWIKILNSYKDLDFIFSSLIFSLPLFLYILFYTFRLRIRAALTNTVILRILIIFMILDILLLKDFYLGIFTELAILWALTVYYSKAEGLVTFLFAFLMIGFWVLSLLFGLSQFTYKLNLWVYTFFVIGTVQFIIEGKRTSKDRISYKEYIKKIYKT